MIHPLRDERMRPPMALTRSVSLRRRLSLLAASVVAIAVALLAFAGYQVVSRALHSEIDSQLQTRADDLIQSSLLSLDPTNAASVTLYTSEVSVALVYPNLSAFVPAGASVPIGGPERAVAQGQATQSLRTVDGRRVLAERAADGTTVVIAQDLQPTRAILGRLGWVLLALGAVGVAIAAVAGRMVARAGLRPVVGLGQAIDRVARTDELRPIPVVGDDELARLTDRFNAMLEALRQSRERQSRLVSDAGHELRTPLTSLRTNVELLIVAARPDAPALPAEEMASLRADVMAQIDELSTLVGDLVDLAGEEAPEVADAEIDLTALVLRALERVRRRRTDLEFAVTTVPWELRGDPATLERALTNVFDNAAKWSPEGGRVDVAMAERPVPNGKPGSRSARAAKNSAEPVGRVEISVDDQGPGIAEADRELVFDRFYRSDDARSMPGSGLGLSIVRQVISRHGGTVVATASPSGGARIVIELPGTAVGGQG